MYKILFNTKIKQIGILVNQIGPRVNYKNNNGTNKNLIMAIYTPIVGQKQKRINRAREVLFRQIKIIELIVCFIVCTFSWIWLQS